MEDDCCWFSAGAAFPCPLAQRPLPEPDPLHVSSNAEHVSSNAEHVLHVGAVCAHSLVEEGLEGDPLSKLHPDGVPVRVKANIGQYSVQPLCPHLQGGDV